MRNALLIASITSCVFAVGSFGSALWIRLTPCPVPDHARILCYDTTLDWSGRFCCPEAWPFSILGVVFLIIAAGLLALRWRARRS